MRRSAGHSNFAQNGGTKPTLLVPSLSDGVVDELERAGVSGLDFGDTFKMISASEGSLVVWSSFYGMVTKCIDCCLDSEEESGDVVTAVALDNGENYSAHKEKSNRSLN